MILLIIKTIWNDSEILELGGIKHSDKIGKLKDSKMFLDNEKRNGKHNSNIFNWK